MKIFGYIVIIILGYFSCKQNGVSKINEKEDIYIKDSINLEKTNTFEVFASPLKKQDFICQSIATGKLSSHRKYPITFEISGILYSPSLQEGQNVKKGQMIAQLKEDALQLQLEQVKNELEEAFFRKNDLLIRSGGEANKDTSVNQEILTTILVQSGVNKALQNIKQVEYKLEQTHIYAPFNGVIADVKTKQYHYVTLGQEVGTLVDDNNLEVLFFLLEKEAIEVEKLQTVKVLPIVLPNVSLTAKVNSINPIVDQHGLVQIKAQLLNHDNIKLFDGMNVRVVLERRIPRQLVVPKSSLVMRSGKHVVFTFVPNSETAKWNWVEIGQENDENVTILKGLQESDLVIYDGNLNLDHGSKVTLK